MDELGTRRQLFGQRDCPAQQRPVRMRQPSSVARRPGRAALTEFCLRLGKQLTESPQMARQTFPNVLRCQLEARHVVNRTLERQPARADSLKRLDHAAKD